MKKEKLLVVAVIALLLLNFGTLGFLFATRRPMPPGGRPERLDKLIAETLALNPEQKAQFEKLKSAHHEMMVKSDDSYREAMGEYFSLLKSDVVAPTQQDSLQAILTKIQEGRTRGTLQHFMDLKSICTAEQRKKFDVLIPDLMRLVLPERPSAPPRKTPG